MSDILHFAVTSGTIHQTIQRFYDYVFGLGYKPSGCYLWYQANKHLMDQIHLDPEPGDYEGDYCDTIIHKYCDDGDTKIPAFIMRHHCNGTVEQINIPDTEIIAFWG